MASGNDVVVNEVEGFTARSEVVWQPANASAAHPTHIHSRIRDTQYIWLRASSETSQLSHGGPIRSFPAQINRACPAQTSAAIVCVMKRVVLLEQRNAPTRHAAPAGEC